MIYLLLQNQLIINKIFSSHDLFTIDLFSSYDLFLLQNQLIINKIFSSHDLFTFTESIDNQQNILLS